MEENYDFTQGEQGAVASTDGKTKVTIFLDTDVVEAFQIKAGIEGCGIQALINETLRQFLGRTSPHTGSSFEHFLKEEGICKEVTEAAKQKIEQENKTR
jgi:hypothetical protein